MRENKITHEAVIKEFFHQLPNQDIPVSQVVDWMQDEWIKRTGSRLHNPSSIIRSLLQKGYLTKPKRGYYRYEPNQIINKRINQFSARQRKEVLNRDDNRCCVCGMGTREGRELYVVNFFGPKDYSKNNKLKTSDGLTLCGSHKNMWIATKNTSSVVESKNFFIDAYHQAMEISDTKIANFCNDILNVYEEHGI